MFHGFFQQRYAAERSGRNRNAYVKKQLRTTLRRLRRRVRHATSVQRERALIYRLLAGRFALDFSSPLTSAHAGPKRDAPHDET